MSNKQLLNQSIGRLLLAATFILTFSSCDKLKDMVTFRLELPYSQEFTVDTDSAEIIPPGGITLSLPTIVFSPNADEVMQEHNMTEDKITMVSLKSFVQQIKGAGLVVNSIDSLKLFISSKDQPEVMIAFQDNVPDQTDSVAFECVNKNLKDYFFEDTLYMRLQGHFEKMPADFNLKCDLSFAMVAKPMKEN